MYVSLNYAQPINCTQYCSAIQPALIVLVEAEYGEQKLDGRNDGSHSCLHHPSYGTELSAVSTYILSKCSKTFQHAHVACV